MIYLAGKDGNEVVIKPDVFHDIMEPAPVNGWQVAQESKTSIIVSVVGLQPEYNEKDIINKLILRLEGQGAYSPSIRIKVIEKLQQSATGKTPLVKALKRTL